MFALVPYAIQAGNDPGLRARRFLPLRACPSYRSHTARKSRLAAVTHHISQNSRPLFSHRYKTLLPQLPYFDIDTKPPGVTPSRFSIALLIRDEQNPTRLFSIASALFCANGGWQRIPPRQCESPASADRSESPRPRQKALRSIWPSFRGKG